MADPLFKGLTRPAMMLGVTYSGLIMNAMITKVLFLAFNNLLFLFLALPIHLVMYLVCSWDERFFDILTVYVRTIGGDRFRDIYKASG
jgi:type IV secretion system protein VirB3